MITEKLDNRVRFLYVIRNIVNNKVYIGQTLSPSARWNAHRRDSAKDNPKQVIHNAMKKYGMMHFEFEVIACCRSLVDANEIETLLVSQYDSYNREKGYNISLGGFNAPKTDAWKAQISATLMGHSVSEETRQKQSKSHIGQIAWNKGLVDVMPEPWNKGVPMDDRTRLKCSLANTGRHNSPDTEFKFGNHYSPETEIKAGQHFSSSTEFKKGQRSSIDTEFKVGFTPWNKKFSVEEEMKIANDIRSLNTIAKELNVSKKTVLNIRNRHRKN